MRRMIMNYGISAWILIATSCPALARTETIAELLARAKKQTATVELSDTFSRAIALAHKANDVLVEQQVSDAFAEFLRKIPGDTPGGPGPVDRVLASSRRDAYAGILRKLESKRGDAFVSAHMLGTQLLFAATNNNDDDHVPEAVEAVAAYARAQKANQCASAIALYARGGVARTHKKNDEAIAPLDQALKTCVAEGWSELAAYVGTELAADALDRKQTPKAREAMEAVASTFTKDTSPRAAQVWQRLVGTRLEGAPAEVLEPHANAMKAFESGGGEAGAPGGAGGAPGPTKLGKAWKDFSATAAIVTVQRTKEGFEIREGFDREFKATRAIAAQMPPFADGGVTLAFDGPSAALLSIDLESGPGAPGETPWPTMANAYYRLAVGETYAVSKQGVVTISAK
ncbi:MAG: hypothetical protein HY292_17370 [Planctomycetes bacterium]|nr:hypothetical protein [Planctomycetota bacterium]